MGGWTLVNSGEISASSRYIRIGGLNGNADYFYHLTALIKNDTGVQRYYNFWFNDTATSSFSTLIWQSSSSGLVVTSIGYVFWFVGYLQGYATGLLDLYVAARTGSIRVCQSRLSTTDGVNYLTTGGWPQTTISVTSLRVQADANDGIGVGSYWMLTKPS